MPIDYLRELVGYWHGHLRLARGGGEAELVQPVHDSIDGQSIHFVHARSAHPDAAARCSSPTAGRVPSSSSSM